MPELPEVEITLQGIKPHVLHQKIHNIIIRNKHLRWPIPENLNEKLSGQKLKQLSRRAKYILFTFQNGTLLLHLGMSGNLRILKTTDAQIHKKHDHVDILFSNQITLRLTDPRRFGALLWTDAVSEHPLLKYIGPEPLTEHFDGHYLYTRAQGKKVSVKNYIMNSKIVAGVGNIYAMEALFKAGIRPQKPAGKVNLSDFKKIAKAIKTILTRAIKSGGTSFRDFLKPSGTPGYFKLKLNVYGRGGLPCLVCKTTLTSMRIGQRGTVYCRKCQK